MFLPELPYSKNRNPVCRLFSSGAVWVWESKAKLRYPYVALRRLKQRPANQLLGCIAWCQPKACLQATWQNYCAFRGISRIQFLLFLLSEICVKSWKLNRNKQSCSEVGSQGLTTTNFIQSYKKWSRSTWNKNWRVIKTDVSVDLAPLSRLHI